MRTTTQVLLKRKGLPVNKGSDKNCMAGLESRLSAFLTVRLASLKPSAPGRREAIKDTSGLHSHSPTQGWSKKRLWAWNHSSAGIWGKHGSWTLIFLTNRGMSRGGLPKHHIKAQKSTSQALTLSLAWSHMACDAEAGRALCSLEEPLIFSGDTGGDCKRITLTLKESSSLLNVQWESGHPQHWARWQACGRPSRDADGWRSSLSWLERIRRLHSCCGSENAGGRCRIRTLWLH